MKKNIVVWIISMFTLFLIAPNHSHAFEGHSDHLSHKEVSVLKNSSDNTLFYNPCPEGGKHTMFSAGHGKVYVDGELVLSGITSQCSKCYTVIISQENPFYYWTTSLGDYGIQGALGPVGHVTYMYTNKLYYNSSLNDLIEFVWYF